MDTKWKNKKKAISFLLFFLGISLTLGSMAEILRVKPSGVRIWQVGRLLENDYQESKRFRDYITGRLETFLIMAVGEEALGGIWGYGNGAYYGDAYYGSGYPDFLTVLREAGLGEEAMDFSADPGSLPISAEELTEYLQNLQNMQKNYLELLNAMEELQDSPEQLDTVLPSLQAYQEEIQNYITFLEDFLPERLSREQITPLTEEQKQKIAQKYHEYIKGDRNLLYTILYDGKILYSNSDLLTAADGGGTAAKPDSSAPTEEKKAVGSNDVLSTGSGSVLSTAYGDIILPEGYNFLLYFDGEKARILKDGRELDVYGDGYYREDCDWYLPGYANFQTDDTVKKAAVCIAAAKDPVIFMGNVYGNDSSSQYDNSLYWMNTNLQYTQERLLQSFIALAAGLILLSAAFLLRRSRREAAEGLARFQAKIWVECKIVLFLALLSVLYVASRFLVLSGSGYDLWEEFAHAYDYNYDFSFLSWIFREMFFKIPPLVWILLFWGIWLLVNDLRHNRKMWRCSLTAKLYRTFSAKSLNRSLPRKMSRRNLFVFLMTLLYGGLMLEDVFLISAVGHSKEVCIALLLAAALETAAFLALQYRIGAKNMKTARDVELLSRRITEIRNGDYTDVSAGTKKGTTADREDGAGLSPGNDLEEVLGQLEDIRCGMANAVDEQMKSERMKVELIANVSHDIKTPLTSIISYVEFLKQEEQLPEHVKDYIKILDEKSQRLKNMVTDVFAVSKAASGELPMQMEELDLGKLLRQTLADMEEQIQDSPVAFRTDFPDTPVKILADGQRLYRVFQNLFQNAIKYSLRGSRVYVTLQTDGRLAVASVKNTSQLELDKGKDFTERFARGDQSRTDGGSGLGLSIAQSFTEACGGTFSWETDADLFVVKITFPIL